ncbi:Shedu anti-phage system protein SduA domain-containing protein [Stenotrophomonas maltophilia]|uniref:Shedu anti-phage system protein SduA domain-containing protein n=1 Tax=Stenotrophomonas maltophilia TaxID=40324 RepID=UPI0011B6E144|nr:Shedu anti-phage system protein SduA domain-containing protein [Stenotrophomonas maltophilia]
MSTLTDEQFESMVQLFYRSKDLSKGDSLSISDVSRAIDIKMLSIDNAGQDAFNAVLDDLQELKDELKAMIARKYPNYSQASVEVAGDPYLVGQIRRLGDLHKLGESVSETIEELRSVEDEAISFANLVLGIARYKLEQDVVPLVARGMVAIGVQEAVQFWNRERDGSDRKTEAVWQRELMSRPMLLSRTLGGHIVVVGEQQHVGAEGLDGSGDRITDYLAKHNITNNVTLVELKTPGTELLGPAYRKTFPLSLDLSGSVSQVMSQRADLTKNYFQKQHEATFEFQVDAARCVVIAGDAERELTTSTKRAAFEMQREALGSRVRIITFDELYSEFESFNHSV